MLAMFGVFIKELLILLEIDLNKGNDIAFDLFHG